MAVMADNEASFSAPRGTRDLLPPESWAWQAVVRFALDSFARAGYAPVETPVFEHTEVFERGVGETSEVVGKQMYTFTDRGGRSLTLRPEGTAPVVRAILEHNLHRGPLPVKLAYAGWMFRQERPQKGRYRQFFQIGIEAVGVENPAADAEVIAVGDAYLRALGLAPTLLLNSIGHVDPSCRLGYNETLVAYLEKRAGELAEDDRERVATNPLRTFDSKEEATRKVMAEAPVISDHICPECKSHFEEVLGLLQDAGVASTLEPRLVRGLDYYTRTTFEFELATGLGSQATVLAGGRYDGLAESLGGDRLPGIGFAGGIDRMLLAGGRSPVRQSAVTAYVVGIGDEAERQVLPLATRLRASGIGAEFDLAGRSMKGQMKDASRSGARYAVIIGAEEIVAGEATVKDLASGEQERVRLEDLEGRLAT